MMYICIYVCMCVCGAAQKNCFGRRLIALQILNETFLRQVTLYVCAGVCNCWLIMLFLLHSRKFASCTTHTYKSFECNVCVCEPCNDYDYFFGFLNFSRGIMTLLRCLHELANEREREMD